MPGSATRTALMTRLSASVPLRGGLAGPAGPAATHVIIENDTSAFKRSKITVPGYDLPVLRTVRPGFRRALDLLHSGAADGLIAYDLDRTCRDPRDLEDLIDVIEGSEPRIPVDSVTGSLRLANDADVFAARILVAHANQSSRDTARRVAAARETAAANGRDYTGGRRPYGFERDGSVRRGEAAEIVRAADAVLAGITMRQILLDFRRRGVPTVTGTQWTSTALTRILMRPRTAGIAVHAGKQVAKLPGEPILPESTWQAVVSILSDPARRQTPGNTPRWLGSGLYRCGKCGAPMRVQRDQYRCAVSPHLGRNATRVDEFVGAVISAWLERPDAADAIPTPAGTDLTAARREEAALRERRKAQMRMHSEGLIDDEELAAGAGDLRRLLDRVRGELAAAQTVSPLDGIAGRMDAGQLWQSLDLGRQRAVLAALCTVTLLPAANRGRLPGGGYFDSDNIRVDWHQ